MATTTTTTTRVIRKDHYHQMKNNIHCHQKSQTLPPSPTHSFSSSDFEFTISHSPRKSSTTLCPADELFYKGQLLPLHLSPRLSMVRNLLLPASSSSSETTTSRDSNGSSNDSSRDSTSSSASDLVLLAADHSCDSSRPSSVAEDNNNNLDYYDSFKSFKRLNNIKYSGFGNNSNSNNNLDLASKKKYFSLSRFSSVFKKDPKVQKVDVANNSDNNPGSCSINNSVAGPGSNNSSANKHQKRMSTTAKEVISKYLKKVKPLYEKLSQKQQQKMGGGSNIVDTSASITPKISGRCTTTRSNSKDRGGGNTATHALISHSFSGNLRYPRRRGCVSSCPSSMRSSPTHSGVLCRTAGLTGSGSGSGSNGGIATSSYGDRSSMEELQSAIQGAIAHCKNSLVQSKSSTMVRIEIV